MSAEEMYRTKIDAESDEVSMCLMWDPVGRSPWKMCPRWLRTRVVTAGSPWGAMC